MVRELFRTIRGLAMGQRLAPSLAIAFMSKVEAPVTVINKLDTTDTSPPRGGVAEIMP
ncbi:hypothetical protein KIN20_024893 [Parelaphostrongylus tenuis]|uniref:Uncharacterized protein n=1 Tax=Parelaphostrongylus tenuis TaxID=148309 RepID=A0AAD5ND18_PARTN|nr:hypothetical protein KIN20_024893 [Parelaphostrongylus tenuis]